MSPQASASPEPSLRPPEPMREAGLLRWVLMLAALTALGLTAWHGWDWLQDDVTQRHPVGESRAAAPVQTAPLAEPAPPTVAAGSGGAPPPAAARGADEPPAPAVTGEAIRRCVQPDGQLTFTNQACPAGSRAESAPVASTQGPEPRLAVRFESTEDPSQHDASCHFLAAEIARLDYEFRQPLPPPVIDLISSRLGALRGESEQGRCAPLPKPAVAVAPGERATHKVLTETPVASPKPRR